MYLLFLLLFGHALADYPLQNKYMAAGKNPWRIKEHEDVNKISYARKWYHRLTAHCAIHGGFVMIFTGYWQLGLVEFFAHGCVDLLKCRKLISADVDQGLHVLCKVLYTICLLQFLQ